MSKEVLDDWDWDNPEEEKSIRPDDYFEGEDSENVVMVQTFNSENEAYICAATLKSEGIDAHVVAASTTGQMTPFAYGNVRLFVAKSQAQDAIIILERIEEDNKANIKPEKDSSSNLLTIVAVGLISLLILVVLYFYFVSGNY